jgi:hypothetical protein
MVAKPQLMQRPVKLSAWKPAKLIGLKETYAWRHWEYFWDVPQAGRYAIMARATDGKGRRQPETAQWNVLGCVNNGIREHAIVVQITCLK